MHDDQVTSDAKPQRKPSTGSLPVSYRYRFAASADVAASADRLFDHLDDPRRAAAHMQRRSWQLAGGRMTIETDEGGGRRSGSRIRLGGEALGRRLQVTEVVTVREPPVRKVWETVGEPRLLVIGGYRMGFELSPQGAFTRLRVWIEYNLPRAGLWRIVGAIAGHAYARWCTQRMAADARTL